MANRRPTARNWPGMTAVALLAATVVLAGCGEDTKRSLGLSKPAPDEFSVVSRAPLSLPPDYTLRPPRPGAEGATVSEARQQARQTVFRGPDAAQTPVQAAVRNTAPDQSRGESVLLARAGAINATPDIRTTVDRESAVLARADETFLDRLLNFRDPQSQDPVVNAAAEDRRLREAQALGKAPDGQAVPVIQRKQRGLLEGLF
ncbi:MAG: DUF3035 domain-containing protein [Alphaproteobacteria bacterium]